MTGFRYLIVSVVLIAFATLVSANYQAFGEDATWSMLLSLQGVCENETLNGWFPVPIDCGHYGELSLIDFVVTDEQLETSSSPDIVQISD